MGSTERRAFLFAHVALFIVFFWFGGLKLAGFSPANSLVDALLHRMLPTLSFHTFSLLLGGYEVLISLLFLFRKDRYAFILLVPHLIMTTMPLIVLTSMTWTGFLVPTLEGQYIIKNILIIALAGMVFADMGKRGA